MNIVVLDENELGKPLPSSDRRTRHIVAYLRKKPGDRIRAGVVNRSLGWLHIRQFDSNGMHYRFEPTDSIAPSHYPITVLIGHPRPPATRRLLIDLTALGVAHMVFFCADNSEKSYAHSSLWHTETTAQLLKQGLEYAGAIQLPTAVITRNLSDGIRAVDTLPHASAPYHTHRYCCIAPSDPADTAHPHNLNTAMHKMLHYPQSHTHHNPHIVLAIGAERGWTDNELAILNTHHFESCIIGRRTIRTETAAIGAVVTALTALTGQVTTGEQQRDERHPTIA